MLRCLHFTYSLVYIWPTLSQFCFANAFTIYIINCLQLTAYQNRLRFVISNSIQCLLSLFSVQFLPAFPVVLTPCLTLLGVEFLHCDLSSCCSLINFESSFMLPRSVTASPRLVETIGNHWLCY